MPMKKYMKKLIKVMKYGKILNVIAVIIAICGSGLLLQGYNERYDDFTITNGVGGLLCMIAVAIVIVVEYNNTNINN